MRVKLLTLCRLLCSAMKKSLSQKSSWMKCIYVILKTRSSQMKI